MREQLLLADRLHMLFVVVPTLPLQRDAGFVPAVRYRGHQWTDAGSARIEAQERGIDGQTSCRVRSGDRYRRTGALGGSSLR